MSEASDTLHVLRDPPLDGPDNMARDEVLLHDPTASPAVLRVYAWRVPTLSLGYFQRYAVVGEQPPEVQALPVVRRATGGGAILHDDEITYSIVVDPNRPEAQRGPEALYQIAHDAWAAALSGAGFRIDVAPPELPLPSPRSGPFFCFQNPGRGDLLLDGAKLVGSAQRRLPRTARGARFDGRVLQHGSVILGRRFAAHPGAALLAQEVHRERHGDMLAPQLIDIFVAALAERMQLQPRPAEWTAPQRADALIRRVKYCSREWTTLR